MEKRRNASEARRVAADTYPTKLCVICGAALETVLDVAHLDNDATNNHPDNLAYLCKTHHWMYDAGLYPMDPVKALRDHWQRTGGKPDHSIRMKDAGEKAALTRKRRAAARKAVRTRKQRAAVDKGSQGR